VLLERHSCHLGRSDLPSCSLISNLAPFLLAFGKKAHLTSQDSKMAIPTSTPLFDPSGQRSVTPLTQLHRLERVSEMTARTAEVTAPTSTLWHATEPPPAAREPAATPWITVAPPGPWARDGSQEALVATKDQLSTLLRKKVLDMAGVERESAILTAQIDEIDKKLVDAVAVSPVAALLAYDGPRGAGRF
jgi:hypothetical protein